MAPDGIRIAADNRPAESARRPKRSVVRQRLQQDRNHPLPRLPPANSRQTRHFFGCGKKRRKQRRRKRSPCVISGLVFLANRVSQASQILNDATRHAYRSRIALQRKRNSPQQRPRTPHKRHQRMHRRDCRSPPAQRSEFIAAKCPAGVQRHSSLPIDLLRDRFCGGSNRRVRYAEPHQLGTHRGQIGRRPNTHLPCQPRRLRQRSTTRPPNHHLDPIPCQLQRPRKRRPQIPRPYNRNSSLPRHARQHSRMNLSPRSFTDSQQRTFKSRPRR